MCSMSVSRVLRKVGAGVRAVDRPAEFGHDPGFHGLWIGIVIGAVGGAAVFRCDGEAAIGLGGGGRSEEYRCREY